MVGRVAWLEGVVGAVVGRMVGMDSVMPVGVEALPLLLSVQPQPVNMAAVRTRERASVQIFFLV